MGSLTLTLPGTYRTVRTGTAVPVVTYVCPDNLRTGVRSPPAASRLKIDPSKFETTKAAMDEIMEPEKT